MIGIFGYMDMKDSDARFSDEQFASTCLNHHYWQSDQVSEPNFGTLEYLINDTRSDLERSTGTSPRNPDSVESKLHCIPGATAFSPAPPFVLTAVLFTLVTISEVNSVHQQACPWAGSHGKGFHQQRMEEPAAVTCRTNRLAGSGRSHSAEQRLYLAEDAVRDHRSAHPFSAPGRRLRRGGTTL